MNPSIAYIAAKFPLRSETFVYREVRALRAAGWGVHTISLNNPNEPGLPEFADLENGTLYAYGRGKRATVKAAIVESLAHPIRSTGTMFTAMRDALFPGEPLQAKSRAKLVAQAVAALGIARRLRGAGVKHIHCHFAHAPTTVGMYVARQLGVPFSFTGHANDLFQRRALLARKLERAAFTACISEWHRDLYRDVCPQRIDRFAVIRCGVDLDTWTAKPDACREIPPSEPLRVLTVCRLVQKKGVDTLIRALAQIGRPWHLTVAGDGPEELPLKKLVADLGCADSVTWLGAVRNDAVMKLLSEADVFALACHEDRSGDRDGIPVVLIEAMACGVPVISGDLPAIRELVQHERTGLLVDANRTEALTGELRRMAADAALRKTLAKQARQHVQGEFSGKSNIDRLVSHFTQAIQPADPQNTLEPAPAGPIKSNVSCRG